MAEALELPDIGHYQNPQGYEGLREALVHYLQEFRGITTRAEQIFITGGVAQSLDFVSYLLPADTAIAIENPGFDKAAAVFSKEGRQVLAVPLDKDGILSLPYLYSQKAKAVYVTPSHQFPTGAIMRAASRYKLLAWAKEREAYIIEDDYDSEYSYYSSPVPALQSLDKLGRTIYMGSFSKNLSPALGLGFVTIPHVTVKHPGTGLTMFLRLTGQKNSGFYRQKAAEADIYIESAEKYYLHGQDWDDKSLCLGFSQIADADMPGVLFRLQNAWG